MSISRRLSILALSGLCLSAAAIASPVAAQDTATPASSPTSTDVVTATPIQQEGIPTATLSLTDAAAITATSVAIVAVTPEPAMTSTPAIGGATTYTVQPGDDLYRIGLKFGLSYTVLASANGIINPNLIVTGEKLIIPAGGVVVATPIPSTAMPVAATSATATLPPTLTGVPLPVLGNPDTPATYTVQKGDLLFQIAAQFHTSVSILATLNNLGNGNLIYTGEVLKLPTSGVTASDVEALTPTDVPAAMTSTDANILTTATETPAATQLAG